MALLKGLKCNVSTGSFCHVYMVTDEALIAENAVWPYNFFLMNIFLLLKDLNFSLLFEALCFNARCSSSKGLRDFL